MSIIKNRINKNYQNLKAWAEKYRLEAFRLYDRDIPEFPFIVDKYKDHVVVYDRREWLDSDPKKATHLQDTLTALKEIFQLDHDHLILKERQKQKGTNQYEKMDQVNKFIQIQEGDAKFLVNLWDYLDTGLFLDHRILREKVQKLSSGKKVLNLFSYTCSISVFAALGGGKVTSVDMSNTYLNWGQDNFKLNGLDPDQHQFICENALEYLQHCPEKFDLIICDPPTFSNSKKMTEFFEVEKDQQFLIEQCMRCLATDGTFFFSNNKRDFKLDPSLFETYQIKDLSKSSIPKDFFDQKIHRLFQIKTKPNLA